MIYKYVATTKNGEIYNLLIFNILCYLTVKLRIMPYIEGTPLSSKMIDLAKKTERVAFCFGLQLAQVILTLSQHRVEHFDLHDDNILVTEELEPILIDFDKSKKLEPGDFPFEDYTELWRHLKMMTYHMDGKRELPETSLTTVTSFFRKYLHDNCYPYSRESHGDPIPEFKSLPRRMIALIKGCIDHSDKPLDVTSLERSIQAHEEELRREDELRRKESFEVTP